MSTHVSVLSAVPCSTHLSHLTGCQNFIYSPTDAPVSCLKNSIKIYIKSYIKTTPTYFCVTVTPSSGSELINALPDDDVTVTPKHVGAVLT